MSLRRQLKKFPDVFARKVAKALHDTLVEAGESIANDFAESVSEASLEEIVELRGGGRHKTKTRRKAAKRVKRAAKATRLPRRSAAQIAKAGVRVARLLKKHPDGLRSEGIRSALRIETRALPRILREAVAAKKIVVLSGNKRSTTYGAATRKAAKSAKKK